MSATPAARAQSEEVRQSFSELRVAVSGSSGLIGEALVRSLRADGYQIQRIVRSGGGTGSDYVWWAPTEGQIEGEKLEGVDAVVHLAGENVGQRWTDDVKQRIRDSRVQGTRLLSETLAGLADRPEVLVCASAIGIYGDRGDELLDENSSPGQGFLADVTREWEAATEAAAEAGIRVVNVRFGIVLSGKGGALERMLPPFKLGVGGKLGDGDQWMSWVALPDVVAAIRFVIDSAELTGPVNVVGPHPVRNAAFTEALGAALHRPTWLAVPAPLLKVAMGDMADEALLASQRVVPRRLSDAGFDFHLPQLRAALGAVL